MPNSANFETHSLRQKDATIGRPAKALNLLSPFCRLGGDVA
jgi:hypothetical protein